MTPQFKFLQARMRLFKTGCERYKEIPHVM